MFDVDALPVWHDLMGTSQPRAHTGPELTSVLGMETASVCNDGMNEIQTEKDGKYETKLASNFNGLP
jgi:hypothetical protein